MRIYLSIWMLLGILYGANAQRITDFSAITLSKVPLYREANLSCPDFTVLPAGTLVEVVSQSELMGLDKDQLQLFPWYEVKTTQNATGWVYGNNLASATKDAEIKAENKLWHKSAVDFGRNYGNTTAWFATIQGRDTGEYINNLYREDYMVFTHVSGRSVWQKIARVSHEGATELLQLTLHDLTEDKYPELVVCAKIKAEGALEKSKIEVFKMQNGYLSSIFVEDLTLRLPSGDLSPALMKCVDLEGTSMRVEYIDMQECNNDVPEPKGMKLYCLELVTYTYFWSVPKGSFEFLYDKSRMTPKVLASAASVRLYATPGMNSNVVKTIATNTSLKALRLLSRYAKDRKGDKQLEVFYYVQTPDGIAGYVPAWNISFSGVRHEGILNAWNAAPPLMPDDWDYPLTIVQEADSQ